MRVVQLLPELQQGGVERGVVELNRELVKAGLETIVISAGGRLAQQIDSDGGRHIQFDLASKNLLTVPARIFRLQRLLKSIKPDILHARSRVPAWLAYFANKTMKIPFITTVHGFNSVNPYSRIMTFGEPVICVSNAIKDYIQQHYQVPDSKIRVIPRGVDLIEFDPKHIDQAFIQAFQQQYKLQDKYVVSAVGRITQLKDLETFIQAIMLARKQIPNICGLIVGGVRHDKQAYYESLLQLVKTLNAGSVICFAESQQKIAEVYTCSNVVVSCSKKPESFGRTAAEALAMNVPVVATNHGGIVDIVKDGETGYLVQPEQPHELSEVLIKLSHSELKPSRPFIAAEFSLSRMVDRTLSSYTTIAEK